MSQLEVSTSACCNSLLQQRLNYSVYASQNYLYVSGTNEYGELGVSDKFPVEMIIQKKFAAPIDALHASKRATFVLSGGKLYYAGYFYGMSSDSFVPYSEIANIKLFTAYRDMLIIITEDNKCYLSGDVGLVTGYVYGETNKFLEVRFNVNFKVASVYAHKDSIHFTSTEGVYIRYGGTNSSSDSIHCYELLSKSTMKIKRIVYQGQLSSSAYSIFLRDDNTLHLIGSGGDYDTIPRAFDLPELKAVVANDNGKLAVIDTFGRLYVCYGIPLFERYQNDGLSYPIPLKVEVDEGVKSCAISSEGIICAVGESGKLYYLENLRKPTIVIPVKILVNKVNISESDKFVLSSNKDCELFELEVEVEEGEVFAELARII